MLIKLLTPYVGRENGGNVIAAGEIYDFDAATAAMLAGNGRGEVVDAPAVSEPEEDAPPAPKKHKGK